MFLRLLKRRFHLVWWSLFHPDNLFSFLPANLSEQIAWEAVQTSIQQYTSFCVLGCVYGSMPFSNGLFMSCKIYFGCDVNIVAVVVARLVHFLRSPGYLYQFTWSLAQNSFSSPAQLFVSCATLIYFTQNELEAFIVGLKSNPNFECFILHEMFSSDLLMPSPTVLNLYNHVHSVPLILQLFGDNYHYSFKRTFYSPWESNLDIISGLLVVSRRQSSPRPGIYQE